MFAAAAVMAISCMAQAEILSLNLETGKTYALKTETQMFMSQNMFGQSIDIDMTIAMTTHFRVDSADEQGYDMTVWYDYISTKMGGMTQMNASSGNPADGDPMSGALNAMTNKPFNIKMARNGSIISVTGIEKMLDGMAEDIANNFPDVPENQIEQMRAQFSQSYGENSIKNNIEMGLSGFPLTPVAVGDSWENTIQSANQFPIDINVTFTLAARNSDTATIKGKAVITSSADSAPTEMGGMLVRYSLNGTQTSETVIDAATGWTVSGTTAQEMSGSIVILANEQIPSDMNVPISIKSNTTVTGYVVE